MKMSVTKTFSKRAELSFKYGDIFVKVGDDGRSLLVFMAGSDAAGGSGDLGAPKRRPLLKIFHALLRL